MSVHQATQSIVDAINHVIGGGNHALHAPEITGAEKQFVSNTLETGFVSTFGEEITSFENEVARYTGAANVIAVVNGTAALHLALVANGIGPGDEVLVPTLTFAATAHAVLHSGATPNFIDSHEKYMGIDCEKLSQYLWAKTEKRGGVCYNKSTGNRIAAIIPVHIFGQVDDIETVVEIANQHKLVLIEDAAEALGSWKSGRHAGLFGVCGTLSFNGNKIITTGGGGAVLCKDDELAKRLRHLSTTAKIPHLFLYQHDAAGFNFRMPNINAALGVAQMARLTELILRKQNLHKAYLKSFENNRYCELLTSFDVENWNCWLNGFRLVEEMEVNRDLILNRLNEVGIQCRPIWSLLHRQSHLKKYPRMRITAAEKWAASIVNIPSSARLGAYGP